METRILLGFSTEGYLSSHSIIPYVIPGPSHTIESSPNVTAQAVTLLRMVQNRNSLPRTLRAYAPAPFMICGRVILQAEQIRVLYQVRRGVTFLGLYELVQACTSFIEQKRHKSSESPTRNLQITESRIQQCHKKALQCRKSIRTAAVKVQKAGKYIVFFLVWRIK